MKIDLDQFKDTFFEEAAEHLTRMEAGLLELDVSDDPELLHAIFRSAHSIKGGAGTFGFEDVTRLTHALESILDKLREHVIPVTPELTRLLLTSLDVLKELVSSARQDDPPPADLEDIVQQLGAALNGSCAATVSAASEPQGETASEHTLYHIKLVPNTEFFLQGQDPQLLVRELGELGTIESIAVDVSRIPNLNDLDPECCYIGWDLTLRTDSGEDAVREVFMFVEDACQLVVEAVSEAEVALPARVTDDRRATDRRKQDRRGGAGMDSTSLRVSIDKVDALINLVGELVISQAMVNQVATDFTFESIAQLREALNEVARNTKELQERVMSIRMVPVGTVFSRFPRLVHDLALELDKDIALEMHGIETEIDKGVIEKLGDPLTHLVRNCIDHGIETPDERAAAGKTSQAVVTLRALHEGGNVIIEVADDGRGLNKELIRAKAVKQGLLDEADTPGDDELHAMIFRAGFSTAEQVSDLSGRGVGMDVVRKNIESLNGSVNVSSTPGAGTRIRIRLPLTLAILDGLSVRVASQTYVLPLLSIVESLRPSQGQIHVLLGKGEVMTVRGDSIPVVRLGRVFSIPGAVRDPQDGIMVIMELDGKRFGLFVDELLGQAQIVVKNLESNFKKVDGVMGATILGDGQVALILDVQDFYRLANRRSNNALPTDPVSTSRLMEAVA